MDVRTQLDLLASTPLFTLSTRQFNDRQRSLLSYQRAEAIASCYAFTVDEIVDLKQRFWDLLSHPICCLDTAASTLVTIQLNLAAGTIAQHLDNRPALVVLVKDLLSYRYHGQFMLTEIGHGLDATNLETTATLSSNGFILHTPRLSAAKFMPPVIPAGRPCIAVVFARLMVEGEDRGVRPFIVPLNDGKTMSPGVSTRLMPYREGPSPVNHCITTFNHMRLPITALLGSTEAPASLRLQFLQSIWRVAIGSIALACFGVPTLEISATIGMQYSLRRKVGKPPASILQFRTQQQPILTAVAQAYVLKALRDWAIERFVDEDEDPRIRHGIAACFKAVAVQHTQASCMAISERCGAQGLFAYNQMTAMHSGMRGIAIAEGDILGLAIRLNTELLLGRYALPQPVNGHGLLAQHENGLFNEQRQILSTFESHRSPDFNRKLLPRAQFMIESIGHRMAYEAAVSAGVDRDLIALYEADVIRQDPSWYTAHAGLTRERIFAMHDEAMDLILPRLQSLVDKLGVQAYATAPIFSDASWEKFVSGLEVFGGVAKVEEIERIAARL